MNLLNYLKTEPRARERKNKNRAIGNIITKKYLSNINPDRIEKGAIEDMVGEILSMDRQWRKILEENPDLRGSDYKDKDRLEEEKQLELGYGATP